MSDIQTGIGNMTRKEVIHQLKGLLLGELRTTTKERKALDYAIASLETDEAYQLEYESTTKNETLVSLEVYKQVAWERDIAIEQLHELGYEFGQKIEPTTKNDLGVDCIDRKATLNAIIKRLGIKNETYLLEAERAIYQQILAMPSVTPQEPRWILTTERLPKDRDWYLGIFKEPDTGWINPLPFVCDYVGSETKATTKEYWILRGFTDRDEKIDYYFNLECVAWMPLPESFEPQESEDKDDGKDD